MLLTFTMISCLPVQQGSDAPEKKELSVITCNTGELSGHGRTTTNEIVAALRAALPDPDLNPDVILLQEIFGKAQAKAVAAPFDLPHVAFSFYQGKGNGVAILSRWPLSHGETLYFPTSHTGYGAIAADLRMGNRSLTLVSLHLDNVYWDMPAHRKAFRGGEITVNLNTALTFMKTEFLNENTRSRSVKALIPWLNRRQTDRLIVGGDFNTIPFSTAIRFMSRHFDDALWPSLSYWQGTYRRLSFPIQPRIDYLFYKGALRCLGAEIGPQSPGDHLPVFARFTL